MARNYLRMPNGINVAIARLNQAASIRGQVAPVLSRPLVLPDGRRLEGISFAAAAQALKQYSLQLAGSSLPDIRLPSSKPGQKPLNFKPQTPESVVSGVSALVTPLPDCARNDRIVTFTSGVGVRVYPVGATQAMTTSDALTQPPLGAAWVGDNLLVWNLTELAYVPSAGKALWKTTLKSLPLPEVVVQDLPLREGNPNMPVAGGGPNIVVQGNLIINGVRINIADAQGGRIVMLPGGGVQLLRGPVQPQQAPTEVVRPANEQIDKVRVLSDRAIVGTSDGRIIALDLDGGKPLWQTRLGDHAASHLVANDDFVAARIGDDSDISAQVIVFDAFSGQVLARRNFGSDSGIVTVPRNLALSADGFLVLLLPDRIIGKDLFEPGGLDRPSYQRAAQPINTTPPFASSTSSDHLQICSDRIIAIGDEGMTVRMFALRGGAPLMFGQSAMLRLDPTAAGGTLMMRTTGPMLYIANQRRILSYNLDNNSNWSSDLASQTAVSLRDLFVARGHVVAVTVSGPAGVRTRAPVVDPAAKIQLQAFLRTTLPNGNESGLWEHTVSISGEDSRGIVGWQPVDGGFYYLTGDQKLHFLAGAKTE
jgi:hypothetical protein